MVGGAVAFYSGDVKNLSSDMKIAKPTLMPGKCARLGGRFESVW